MSHCFHSKLTIGRVRKYKSPAIMKITKNCLKDFATKCSKKWI